MKTHLLTAAIVMLVSVGQVQAQTASPPTEGSSAGSGATGMAPQQGTGSGATQSAPHANRAEPGHAGTPQDSKNNREFGRDTQPTGQSMEQSAPAGAKTTN